MSEISFMIGARMMKMAEEGQVEAPFKPDSSLDLETSGPQGITENSGPELSPALQAGLRTKAPTPPPAETPTRTVNPRDWMASSSYLQAPNRSTTFGGTKGDIMKSSLGSYTGGTKNPAATVASSMKSGPIGNPNLGTPGKQ